MKLAFSRLRKIALRLALMGVLAVGVSLVTGVKPAQAACTPLSTPYGSATKSLSVQSNGTYRVWARIMAPDTTANSFLLEVDAATCGVVMGDVAIAANTWTWVDYRDGNSSSKLDVTLTAGSHSVYMVGREENVKIDRIVLTTDTTCVPNGVGDNCATPPDTTNPVVSISAPADGATVSNTVAVNATASDDVGVAKVEFYVDGVLKSTDTTSPFSYSWDTSTATNASHGLTAKAFDVANNNTTSSVVTVTVSNAVQLSCGSVSALICEDFASLPGTMTYAGGTWSAAGGKLLLTSPTAASDPTIGNYNTALHNTTVSGDFDLTVTGKVVATANPFDDFSVIFNYQNANNYYYASFSEDNDQYVNGIFKIVAGVQTQIADFSGLIAGDQRYAIRINHTGSAIQVWRDSVSVASITDTAFTGGRIGVGSRDNAVEFDDLIVQTVVSGDTQAPTVTITAPANGSTQVGTINVTATASDNVGVTRVEFRVDGTLNTTDTTSPFSMSLNTALLTNASHSLTAVAFDAANNSTTSTAVSITVNNPVILNEDINSDGHVNILDFSLLASKFGQIGGSLGRSDINGDGRVNILDFSLLAARFGT